MKGLFWVVMMVGLLVTAYLVVNTLSTPETLKGDGTRLQTIDKAREAADLLNREAEQVEKMLRQSTGQ